MLVAEGEGKEPIGQRIIETLGDLEHRTRRPGGVLYCVGSALASTREGPWSQRAAGTRPLPASIGQIRGLRGLGNVPQIAGRSPSYVVRQL